MNGYVPLLLLLFQLYHPTSQQHDPKIEESPRDEVERLLREYKQNQELLTRLGDRYYQVVYPIQVRHREKMGISTREIDSGYPKGSYGPNDIGSRADPKYGQRHQKHYRTTSLLIKAFQHKFRLDLELNSRIIAPNVQKKVFLQGGATEHSSSASQDVEHCYYHGVVKDWHGGEFIPGSMAALQTCNGVSGIIHLGNETFVIHPFYGGDLSSKHPHIVYQSDQKPSQACGVSNNQLRNNGGQRYRREVGGEGNRTARDVRYQNKYIETGLVLDKAMFDNRPGLSRRDVIHEAIQVANIADLYFKSSLKTRLSIVYLETWQLEDMAPGIKQQNDINRVMDDFSTYINSQSYDIQRDTTVLLTGRSFLQGKSTTASVNMICTKRSVGVSADINPFEPHILASNLAHSIGHNLGFTHDEVPYGSAGSLNPNPCGCPDWHGCIMRSTVSGEDGIQPYKFSACSVDHFQRWMDQGSALCLLNKPSEGTFGGLSGPGDNSGGNMGIGGGPGMGPGSGRCGNGYVDEGEDCDCGSDPTCASNPCCSSYTCRLNIDAQCSSGECCQNCKLKQAGIECRKPMGECDLPEFCSGTSGECPEDLYFQDGAECSNGDGYCFGGMCPTMKSQCKSLWGHGAIQSLVECFSTYNVKGNQQGNCGKKTYQFPGQSEYKECKIQDVMCGTIHCMKGRDKPVIDGVVSHINSQSSVDDKQLECKVMSGSMPGYKDQGIVQDGSKCGEGKYCMNQTCVQLPMQENRCMSIMGGKRVECSDRGVCSNRGTCVCTPGWTGMDCSVNIPTPWTEFPPGGVTPTFFDPGTTKSNTHILKESDSDTIMMVVILVVGVGGIFILFAILALCYRRKSALPKYDPPYLKRPILPGGGGAAGKPFGQPHSPHPNHPAQQHFGGGPHEQQQPNNMEETNKMINFTPTPTYRSMEEHGMKRMGNHTSFGSTHQIPSSNQILGSGQNMMSDQAYQSEKGILKKPGPYCSMDKDRDRWDDRISSSSQNNLINVGALPPPNHVGLSNHHSRQELAPHQHNTMSRSDLAHAANSLSRQDLTDHHSLSRQELPGHSSLSRQDISGRATLSGHSTLARGAANHAAMHPGYSTISRSGPTSMSRENLAGGHSSRPLGPGGHVSLSREELTGHGIIDRQDSRRDMSEVDRTLKSLNGYHEDILEALRDAASSRSANSRYCPPPPNHDTPVLNQELKRQGSGSALAPGSGGGGDYHGHGGEVKHDPGSVGPDHNQDEMGPIRIRNLEDLIRQLEQSSNRHMSPVGGEEHRLPSHLVGGEEHRLPDPQSDRHFSGMNHDGGRYHSRGQGSGGQGGRSPALSLASGSGGQRSRRGSRRSPLNSPGTPMYNEVLSQPGVKPTQDISDSEDYLRNKLLRSASEEGLNIPSTPEFSFDGNLEGTSTPYRREQASRMVSPTSPVSESGSSYHGSARSEQDSYTTHSERSFTNPPQREKDSQRKYFPPPPETGGNMDVDELMRARYFDYKH